MIRVRQHIPNYVDRPTPKQAECQTLADVLKLAWVKQWESGDLYIADGLAKIIPFYRWSLSKESRSIMLMAELDDGKVWWVVAHLSGDVPAGELPEWQIPAA